MQDQHRSTMAEGYIHYLKNICMLSTVVISCAYIVRHFLAQSHNLNSDLAFPSDSLAWIYGLQFVAAEWFDGNY